MTAYQFIFSKKTPQRIVRHITFWLVFSLHIFVFRFYVYDLSYLSNANTYLIRLKDLLVFLPVSLFYAYFAVYFLLPAYILQGRYGRLFIVIVLTSMVLLTLSYLASEFFNIRLAWDMPLMRATIIKQVDFTLNNGLVYPITVSAFAIGIKMGKNFYLQQKRNEQLAKQKIEAEVQLLKSQMHPRFLFHSLNSIYNDMMNGAKQSPGMLLKLSDLLSYILYESDVRLLLDKELLLLKNYIDLEKTGRGKQLMVEIEDDIDTSAVFIEPLLLLPLAEYIFIRTEDKQPIFLSLKMHLKKETFYFDMKGQSKFIKSSLKEEVQLLQVQKRLQAQYGDKYSFAIKNDEDSIAVSLSLELNEVKAATLTVKKTNNQ